MGAPAAGPATLPSGPSLSTSAGEYGISQGFKEEAKCSYYWTCCRNLRRYNTERDMYDHHLLGRAFWGWAGSRTAAMRHAEGVLVERVWTVLALGAQR